MTVKGMSMTPTLGLPGQAKKKTIDPRMIPRLPKIRAETYHLLAICHTEESLLIIPPDLIPPPAASCTGV